MKKIKYITALFFLALVGCNTTQDSVRNAYLPESFVQCKHFADDTKIKYTDIVIYPNSFCVLNKCVDQLEITDVYGKVWFFNNVEFENEWICEDINK